MAPLRTPLVVAALPFGYGPAAKAITLARRLRADWRLVFVGTGPALEMASRAPGVFDVVERGTSTDLAGAARIAEAWGVLSVMDRDAGIAAHRLGRPLFVVDSLLWMRPAVPEALRHARVYWAIRFPGLSPTEYEPRPEVIGPVVGRRAPDASRRREGLVVHLGGSAAPDDRRHLYASYARFVLDAVIAAGLPARHGRVAVIGGRAAVEAISQAGLPANVHASTAPPDEARERMAGAAAVLTAPGLTATLECFADGTPTWFLPPQNYSQWCILRRLRAAGVADGALHGEDLPGAPRLPERMRREEYEPAVRAAVAGLAQDAAAGGALCDRLRTVGDAPGERAAAQGAFFDSLGPDGEDEVVSTLRRLRESGTDVPPAVPAATVERTP